jgi:hypothetical protein
MSGRDLTATQQLGPLKNLNDLFVVSKIIWSELMIASQMRVVQTINRHRVLGQVLAMFTQ